MLYVSQSWVSGASHPSGRLVSHWQAPNLPTYTVRGGCGATACVDANPKCAAWAADGQCELNPGYMRNHCRKSCATCDAGNYTGFTYVPSKATPGLGSLRVAGLCLDSKGQLPAGHSGSNVLHALPCADGATSQLWAFNQSDGAIHQRVDGGGGELCVRVFATWLWDRPIVDTAPCDAARPGASERWTLHSNDTLSNGQYGCVQLSEHSGPASTLWSKPLERGRMAVLAINGADLEQQMTIDFADLDAGAQQWQVRDVWAAQELGTLTKMRRAVAPHDSILLILTPAEK